MTLIVSVTSWRHTIQVTDRLVTRYGTVYDPLSNKNIVYVARDAIVSIAYTGPAYLGPSFAPTDQRIVEMLTDRMYPRFGVRWTAYTGPRDLVLGLRESVSRLLSKLPQALAHSPAADRAMHCEVVMTGWTWDCRNPPEPFLCGIRKAPGASPFEEWWEPTPPRDGQVVSVAPDENVRFVNHEALRTALRSASSAESVAAALVAETRAVAGRTKVVGPNCMAITISVEQPGKVLVRYDPLSVPMHRPRIGYSKVQGPELPGTYSPWIVTPGSMYAPAVLVGSASIGAGDIIVELQAPTVPARGLRLYMGTQERTSFPRA